MSRMLLIAEKPSQAKAYAEAYQVINKSRTHIELAACPTFPAGAVISWGIGHLVGLSQPEDYKPEWKVWSMDKLPILPETYTHQVAKDKVDQFNAIKKMIHSGEFSTLVNCCDVDREGSNIFYSIVEMANGMHLPVKRLWINSLEVDAIRKGFSALRDNEQDLLLYQEAKSRQISDWLVGINMSRMFSILLNQNLSIGRVQTPTVHLIYERQKEIEHFVSKPFYEIEGTFKAASGTYKGKVKFKTESPDEVRNLLATHGITSGVEQGAIQSLEKKEKRKLSPKLHSLSSLQGVANRRWKYSPSDVLGIVQSLYEKKILSYPRTDTQFITTNEFEYLQKNLQNMQRIAGVSFTPKSMQPQKRFVDNKKVAEHHAIVPTKSFPSDKMLGELSSQELNVYKEVLSTTLAMFHTDYIYEETRVITNVKELLFESIGNIEKDKGWQVLFPVKEKKEDEENQLPALNQSEAVQAKVAIKKGMTTPPKPYTEGQLIQLMKTCGKSLGDEAEMEIMKEVEGLGTEATRSNIIEAIKKQGYIEVKKNIVNVTAKGVLMCTVTHGTLLASPSMTAKWETYLKKIGKAEGKKELFVGNVEKFVSKTIDESAKILQNNPELKTAVNKAVAEGDDVVGTCPLCKQPVLKKKAFYGCSNYKSGCKFTINGKILGKTITKKHAQDLCAGKKTTLIKGMVSKGKKPFDAYLTMKDGKLGFEFPPKEKAKK